MRCILAFLAFLALLVFSGCRQPHELNVSAAASLQDAMREIARGYEAQRHVTVRLNSGASSMLAMQIRAGASTDLFISADEAKIDALGRDALLVPGTRRNLLANTLVVVVPRVSQLQLRSAGDLASPAVKRIAIAESGSVPAGIYAKEWLTRAGVWTRLAERVVPAENVRAALALVENGSADAAIVYRTDAAIAKQSRIAFAVSGPAAPRIVYPVGIIARCRHESEARTFVDYLTSPTAAAVFRKHGFIVL